jgi:hypothetical protein
VEEAIYRLPIAKALHPTNCSCCFDRTHFFERLMNFKSCNKGLAFTQMLARIIFRLHQLADGFDNKLISRSVRRQRRVTPKVGYIPVKTGREGSLRATPNAPPCQPKQGKNQGLAFISPTRNHLLYLFLDSFSLPINHSSPLSWLL